MVDRSPTHHVQLAPKGIREDPNVQQRHHQPVPRIPSEVVLGVLGQVFAAELAAQPRVDRDAVPHQLPALKAVESRNS